VSRKPVISIIDDDESVRESTADLVKAMGFAAKTHSSAEDFLKSNHIHMTACLIADMRMSGISGLELHTRLRRSGNVIQTILVTAFPNEQDRASALRAGVTCYLVKPFSECDLVACVRSALEAGGPK
jgi:FixJ family two-component response regulator